MSTDPEREAALNELSWELDNPRALKRTAARRSLLWALLILPTWVLVAVPLTVVAAAAGAVWWLLK